MISGIEKLKGYQLLSYLFLFLAIVIPGVGYLYLVEYEKFLSFEFGKLLLVSMFYSFPIFTFGIVDYVLHTKSTASKKVKSKGAQAKKDKIITAFYDISVFTLVSFYLSVFVYLFTSLNLLYWMYFIPPLFLFARVLFYPKRAWKNLKDIIESI